jgi:hypothetical protein
MLTVRLARRPVDMLKVEKLRRDGFQERGALLQSAN